MTSLVLTPRGLLVRRIVRTIALVVLAGAFFLAYGFAGAADMQEAMR